MPTSDDRDPYEAGWRHGEAAAKAALAEVERLRGHIAALIEILRDKPCPYDARYTIGECQQCGCSEGLLTGNERITESK
jgi:hypothetical protein